MAGVDKGGYGAGSTALRDAKRLLQQPERRRATMAWSATWTRRPSAPTCSVSKGNGAPISMDCDSQCGFRSLVVMGSTFKGNTAASSNGGAVYLFDNDAMKSVKAVLPGGVEQYLHGQPVHQRHDQVLYRWFPAIRRGAGRERGSERVSGGKSVVLSIAALGTL